MRLDLTSGSVSVQAAFEGGTQVGGCGQQKWRVLRPELRAFRGGRVRIGAGEEVNRGLGGDGGEVSALRFGDAGGDGDGKRKQAGTHEDILAGELRRCMGCGVENTV